MNKTKPQLISVKKIFRSTSWFIYTDEYRSGFRSFIDYFLDKDARKMHEKNVRKKIDEEMENSEELVKEILGKDEYKEVFAQARVKDIYKAYTALTRQSTVIISTLFETFIQEFFTCIFCLYPQRMYKYLILSPENPIKGKIDLNDVLAVTSLSNLILDMAKKAAEQANKGKLGRIVSNLEELTNNKVDTTIINKMDPIILKRNEIVHEFTHDEIDAQVVMNYYSILLEVIEHVETTAEKIGIETDKLED